ncbi:hypothetical protein ACGC1H_003507 [Rhizoctonia solani]
MSDPNGDPEFVLPDLTTNNIFFCGIHQIDEPAIVFEAHQFSLPERKELYVRQCSKVLCFELITPSAGQLVVVKGIRPIGERYPQELARNELLIWRLLNPHPNIASLLGIANLNTIYDGCIKPLAVCCYCEGGTPREFMQERKINSRDRLGLLMDIAKGVAHIHRQSIVHGDLKADNIVIETSQGEIIPKVIDFGSSRLACSGCRYDYDNKQGGTFQWISPEVRQGKSGWTTQSDIWAFGCVALEVQLDTLPYTRRGEVPSLQNAFWKQQANELPAARKDFESLLSWDVVASEVWKIIEGCWGLNPGERPSAEELVINLRQVEQSTNEFEVLSTLYDWTV